MLSTHDEHFVGVPLLLLKRLYGIARAGERLPFWEKLHRPV